MAIDNGTTGVNQQRIADLLGISRTTVSRCFTNHPGINPVTRARVFDVASQMGYQHMEMRAPAKPRPVKTGTVGVLVCTEIEEYLRPDYESPGVQIYAGICETCPALPRCRRVFRLTAWTRRRDFVFTSTVTVPPASRLNWP